MSKSSGLTVSKVLIVDDQPEFREFARELLDSDVRLEVVLMDLDMPEMNGLEAIERIRDQFPAVRTVIISVHDEGEYRALALEAGAIDFINKRELSPQRLRAALAKAS